jgi:hypothetical protein
MEARIYGMKPIRYVHLLPVVIAPSNHHVSTVVDSYRPSGQCTVYDIAEESFIMGQFSVDTDLPIEDSCIIVSVL